MCTFKRVFFSFARIYLYKFELGFLGLHVYSICKKKKISFCEFAEVIPQTANPQITKGSGSANRKSENFYICKRFYHEHTVKEQIAKESSHNVKKITLFLLSLESWSPPFPKRAIHCKKRSSFFLF